MTASIPSLPQQVEGSQDESGYLDQYSILESIADGTTLDLSFPLARPTDAAAKELAAAA